MNISSGTGDCGFSSVSDGEKLMKDSQVFECLGVLDELSAFVAVSGTFGTDKKFVEKVTADLSKIMSYVSTKDEKYLVKQNEIFDENLMEFKGFSFVFKTHEGALLNLARTMCRRAERRYISYGKENLTDPLALVYLNRLSDRLFIMAENAEGKA